MHLEGAKSLDVRRKLHYLVSVVLLKMKYRRVNIPLSTTTGCPIEKQTDFNLTLSKKNHTSKIKQYNFNN